MFLPGLIIDKLAPLILEQLAYHLTNKLQNNTDLENDPLTTQLNAIEDRLETGPLKVGLEFLKLGDLLEARHELVRACVANPHSAVARLCLGILLYNEGQLQQGLANFKQAIEMNPFVCLPPLIQPAQVITLLNGQFLPEADSNQEKILFWSRYLQEEGVLSTIPPPNDPFALGRWLPTKGKGHELVTNKLVKAGPILTAANSGKQIAIVWQLLEGPETTQVLSLFEQKAGTCLWSLRIPNKQLHLASPTYIILTSGSEDESYEFFSSETGQYITTMGKSNYEVTFCPNARSLPDIQAYKRSNHRLKEKEEVYVDASFDYKVQATKTPSRQTYNKEYKDECILADPLGLSANGVKITNTWEYKNSLVGYRNFSRRIDELNCTTKINNILLLKNA